MSSLTGVRHDLDVQITRIVVAALGDADVDVALRRAREETAAGHEVVHLGASNPTSVAWVARAEDAAAVVVVAADPEVDRLRDALGELGLPDVAVVVVPR